MGAVALVATRVRLDLFESQASCVDWPEECRVVGFWCLVYGLSFVPLSAVAKGIDLSHSIFRGLLRMTNYQGWWHRFYQRLKRCLYDLIVIFEGILRHESGVKPLRISSRQPHTYGRVWGVHSLESGV